MGNGTGPAWQVRESARGQFLENIKRKIIDMEEDIGRVNIHRILLRFIEKELISGRASINTREFGNIPQDHQALVFGLFLEISASVRTFQRTETEGDAILAKLFIWIASEIAQPYASALQTQEMNYPKKIYGVEDRTQEIPFE